MALSGAPAPLPVVAEPARVPAQCFGSDRPPPGSLELPFAATSRLWLAIQLTEPARLVCVATRCQRFTSWVSLAPPDEILLEVQGSLRLFGGLQALIARIVADLGGQDVTGRCAVGPTPASALWLARVADPAVPPVCVERAQDLPRRLAQIPLACLRWPEAHLIQLARLGVATVGDLLRLPRAGLARRLGREVLQALDRALGRAQEPRAHFHPAPRYRADFEPEAPIHTTPALAALLRARLGDLQAFLSAHQAAIDSLTVWLRHGKQARTPIPLAPATPCGSIDRLSDLLDAHLARLKLPAPVLGVRLCSGPVRPQTPANASFLHKMEGGRNTDPQAALSRLVEQLQARLGTQALCGVRCAADHRPERAHRQVPVLAEEKNPPPPQLGPRPLWLWESPRLLPPEAPRRWRIECGPERIESGWWDGADVVRDYFIVREPTGVRWWVYRERNAPRRWYVQGMFG